MWMQLAAMAMSAFGGASAADKENAAQSRNFIAGMNRNIADNQTIAEANLQNTIRTGYRAGILNVQKGQQKVAAVRAGADISAKGVQALGQSAVDAAASGSIGSSVDAVSDNIRLKMDAAQGDVDLAWEATRQNFDQQLSDLVQAGQDTLRHAVNADTSTPALTDVGEAAFMGAAKTAVGFAANYAEANMRLGLGEPKSSLVGGGLRNNGSSISGFRF